MSVAEQRQVEAEKLTHKHLIFRVGGQYYGAPLDDIIEVVEPFEVTPSPNSPKELLGMINLRGEILTVVDLRIVLRQEQQRHPKMLMIIVATENGKTAVLVDELIEVHDFEAQDLTESTNLRTDIPKGSLMGVGKYKSRVVYLIMLPGLLTELEKNGRNV